MKLDFWLSDNKDYAKQNVLCMVMGYLEYSKKHNNPVTAEEILQYIENSIQEEEDRLNKSFPNKARWKGEESA